MLANVDRANFAATLLAIALVSVPLLLDPARGAATVLASYTFISSHFGWLYLLAGVAALGLLLFVALSRFGTIRLGGVHEPPAFSTRSWVGMLFCAGVGAGLMYWAAIEWAHYYEAPPFDAEPRSLDAARWSSAYGLFHWGPIAWALYGVPTVAIAFPFHNLRAPVLKYSVACHHFLRGRENRAAARFMDFLFMVALIGGAGSSLGFSTPLIAALISRLTGIEADFQLEVFVVGICVVAFACSVYAGLERGIKRLSDANMLLALLLLALVFVTGPTLFIIKSSISAVGTVAQNFLTMSSWADPFSSSRFVEDWTVFYWAWWVAYGPFVGIFVTRISRGRTLREVIFGMLVYGSLGGGLFYMVLGNLSMGLHLAGDVDILAVMAEHDGNRAIVAAFDQLPLPELAIGLFCIVCVIFSATTYDSAALTLAASASRSLAPNEDPPRWHRTLWAFALAILPLSLMYIGGLRVAQTAVLVASLPILITSFFAGIALLKALRAYPGDAAGIDGGTVNT